MTRKPQAPADAKPVQPVDPPAPALQPAARGLEAMKGEVKDLAARIDELEEKVATTTAASLPIQTAGTGTGEPVAGLTRLQDVLPDIKALSEKVGGLEQLSRIVDTLKQAKQ